jgi:DNA-binding NarL/FixJ family response regulator
MTADARVLLVDENDDFLDGLAAWIGACPGFEIAGIAHSGREALQRIDLLEPDVVLMDISLPDMNGLEVTRRISARARKPLVILMTFHDLTAIRVEASLAGADACLAKPEIARNFLDTAGRLWAERGRHASGTIAPDKTRHRPTRRTDS